MTHMHNPTDTVGLSGIVLLLASFQLCSLGRINTNGQAVKLMNGKKKNHCLLLTFKQSYTEELPRSLLSLQYV